MILLMVMHRNQLIFFDAFEDYWLDLGDNGAEVVILFQIFLFPREDLHLPVLYPQLMRVRDHEGLQQRYIYGFLKRATVLLEKNDGRDGD
jgi:hypothetical protein